MRNITTSVESKVTERFKSWKQKDENRVTGISEGNCSAEIDSRVYTDFLEHFRETFFNLIFDREAEGI